MVSELDLLRHELNAIQARFRKITTQQINRKRDKEAVREFVLLYFKSLRENVVHAVGENLVHSLDALMQDLLRCAQGRTATKQYGELFRQCEKEINELETKCLVSSRPNERSVLVEKEKLIMRTLEKVCPAAAGCYKQGLKDLEDAGRKSWRGTIVEFRETLRETLDTLAPDEEMGNQAGFRTGVGAKERPTMKEKVRFVLRSRKWGGSQSRPAEHAVEGVENTFGALVRAVYDRASTGVHRSLGIEEAKRVKEWVTLVLAELLEVRA